MLKTGDWMLTYTGKVFQPTEPDVRLIDHRDIAHALSMICRFGGHTQRFYSVAEHCVLMSQAVAVIDAPWALMHDAAEAYLGDVIRPLKVQLPDYCAVERQLLRAICHRYGLAQAFPVTVMEADNRILLDERQALLAPSPKPWGSHLESLKPLGVKIQGWSPVEAEHRWLTRFNELFGTPPAAWAFGLEAQP